MEKQIKLNIKPSRVKEFKNGYPLITKDSILNIKDLKDEGTIVNLYDVKNNFIAKGYYGRQNKGYGWILTTQQNEKIDQIFFEKKIRQAIETRKVFYKNQETTAFRIFNGEGDGIGGLIIDYFGGYYLINWYSKGIYSFKQEIVNALQKVVPVKAIYQKKRFDAEGKYIEENDFITGEEATFPIIVKENNVNFAVYLNDGAMVGVFLDQREVRKCIREKYAKGKNVLNTFSYTGAFSVFAALGDAKKTTSVDLANRSLSKTIEQFEINGIDLSKQEIVVEDVFKYFKYAQRKQLQFDIVILDPPSFARSKKFTFSAEKDYKNLLKETIAITQKQGMIVASTNCSSFNMYKFKEFIDTAFKEMNRQYQILEQFALPHDFKTLEEFKEGNYLKVVFIKCK